MSPTSAPPIEHSAVDEMRFGIATARARAATLDDVRLIESFCAEHQTKLLIVRVPSTALDIVQELERRGARLMDTLVYYVRPLRAGTIPELAGTLRLRTVTTADGPAIGAVARESFKGYFGHYHADPRLDSARADEGYVSWAERSVTHPGVADDVIVAEDGIGLLGFATMRMSEARAGEGVLFAVSPRAQGQGVYREFMIRGMQWSAAHGADRMVVSTQITNLAVQKVWCRLGFEPGESFYTFHRWFDGAGPDSDAPPPSTP